MRKWNLYFMLHVLLITDTVGVAPISMVLPISPGTGGKTTSGSVDIGITRDAKIKEAVKQAKIEAETRGDDPAKIAAAMIKKRTELEGKKEEDINKILQTNMGKKLKQMDEDIKTQKRYDDYDKLTQKEAHLKPLGKTLTPEETTQKESLRREFKPKATERIADSYNGAKKKSNDLMEGFKKKLDDKAKYYKDNDPGGLNKKFANDQNKSNKASMQNAANQAVKAANEMQSKMQAKRNKFGELVQKTAKEYQAETQKLLTNLQTPMEGVTMQVEPGQGIVNGEFIELAGWEMDMAAAGGPEDWASAGKPSEDKVSASNDMLDLLVKECYRGIASGNKKQVDKNCLKADILTYKCETPIDAAFYIGVTFDKTKGYNPAGFRGKLVKHWCREKRKYKKQFDIPDGMHIQGVYDTSVDTTVTSTESEFFQNEAEKTGSLNGEAVFSEDKEQDESQATSSVGVTASASGGKAGVGSAGANAQAGANSGNIDSSSSFETDKTNVKIGALDRDINSKKTKDTDMYAHMSINVIRYEMFLREVGPQYLHEDFLDCFMMLPNSFYAPKAPEKFQDFISRYGTHYVHAAKFGGQLTITKKKKIIDGMTISDMREEAQKEMDSIVGVAATKHKADKTQAGGSVGGSGGVPGASVTAGVSVSANVATEEKSKSNSGTVTVDELLEAENEINRDRFRKSSTSTKVVAIGGSHKIATTITDLYSTNFRSNLVKWLDSIPLYPKPFEMQMLPITDLMKHLIDDMIDPTCYESCIINKEENCLKERKHKIGCDTVFAQQSEQCKQFCVDPSTTNPECELDAPRIIDCYEIVEQKSRMKRKIEALQTATALYLKTGSLYPPTHYTIANGAPSCTTAYHTINPNDDFATTFGESEEQNWNEISVGFIEVQLNMKTAYFNLADQERINPNENFYIIFDQTDRRWYTLGQMSDRRIPEFSSPPVAFSDLKSVETNTLGVFATIPTTYLDGDEEFAMFRMKQGFWLEINLKNGDVLFTERCLEAMKRSPDNIVKKFRTAYSETLESMAAGTGQVIGFINPIIEKEGVTPFPCNAFWTDAQQFDGTDDVQQCIKITVSTVEEYFFIIAASIEDRSSWIYVHQTQNTLCLHQLDRATLSKDKIGSCATKYRKMASGTMEDMVEQLYFCVYKKDDLLSISLSRPSFNRQDREAAITILSHNLIQGSTNTSQLIMPRYFAVGSGQSAVFVKSIFMTEIESLECRDPFIKKSFGGSFKCTLECDEQCSDYGCMQPNDPKKCYTCKNSKLILSRPERDDVTVCVDSCTAVNPLYELEDEVLETQIRRDSRVELKDRPNQIVCVNCHHECAGNCNGVTQFECEKTGGKNWGCKNFQLLDQLDNAGVSATECVGTCPSGTYELTENVAGIDVKTCTPCDSACSTCDGSSTQEICNRDGTCPAEYAAISKCYTCAENHLEVVLDVNYVLCIDNTNEDQVCPAGFHRNANQCHKAWRPIGYQNLHIGSLTATCNAIKCEMDINGNFLSLISKDDFEKFKTEEVLETDEYFSFQLAWKVDACTVVILEWKQQHNPLDIEATDRAIEVFGFRQLKCNVTDPNLANLKKISFANSNFFIGCPEYSTTKYNTTDMGFTGLTLNTDNTATTIFKGSSTGLYSFGELTISETEDIKAFKIGGKDTFSSSEMQLSIHDEREPPIGWSSWDPKQGSDLVAGGLCKRDCTTGAQTVERTRYCRCVPEGSTTEINDQDDVDDFNAGCQPCIGARTQTDTCEIADCGIPTQTASTPEYYHHGCCEKSTAIRVMGLNEDGNNLGLNGVYELVYQDEDKKNHKYAYLGDADIVIERQIVNNVATNWVFKRNGVIEHESGRIIGPDPTVADLYHPAQCPVDAGGWTVYGTVQPYPAAPSYLAVSCSTGRNTCPLTHPYSFNKGKKCCASPFMHSGTNVALSGKLLTPYDDDPEGIVTDNVGNIPLETDVSCLGHWINCPHMDTTKYSRTIRCRTNLKSPGNFKATQSGVYAYGYVLCTNHCNTVYLESTPEN